MEAREVGNPNGNNALLDLAKRLAQGNQGVDGGIGALAEQIVKMQESTQETLKALAEENRQMRERLALLTASEEKNKRLQEEYQQTVNARFQILEQSVDTRIQNLEQAISRAGNNAELQSAVASLRSDFSRHSHQIARNAWGGYNISASVQQ